MLYTDPLLPGIPFSVEWPMFKKVFTVHPLNCRKNRTLETLNQVIPSSSNAESSELKRYVRCGASCDPCTIHQTCQKTYISSRGQHALSSMRSTVEQGVSVTLMFSCTINSLRLGCVLGVPSTDGNTSGIPFYGFSGLAETDFDIRS